MRLLTLTLIVGLTGTAFAQDSAAVVPEAETITDATPSFAPIPADAVDLDDFLWNKRPVVIFTDTPDDPRLGEQLDLLLSRSEELIERDVIIITDTERGSDTDIRLKLRPRGFMLVLIGKDGEVKLRKPNPWDVRELTRVIDKMPMRQRELRANQ